MASGGGSLHKKDWLKLGAAAGLAATGLGAAGVGPMAGLFAAAAPGAAGAAGAAGALGAAEGAGVLSAGALGSEALGYGGALGAMPAAAGAASTAAPLSFSSGLLQGLGGMGSEQASILAAQNAGLGLGADKITLDAAATASGGTPWSALTTGGKAGIKGLNVMRAMEGARQQQLAAPLSPPQRPKQQDTGSFTQAVGGSGNNQMPPVGTPEYYEWMRRMYGL